METPLEMTRCEGCGGLFPQIPGPVHRYMDSSPGCWAVYGEVLAREYSDAAYFGAHRLTVDAYAAQHPGQPSPQSIQSVAIHLLSLCLVFERGLPADRATAAMQEAAKTKERFRWLEPPPVRGQVTAADVHGATSAREHAEIVRSVGGECLGFVGGPPRDNPRLVTSPARQSREGAAVAVASDPSNARH